MNGRLPLRIVDGTRLPEAYRKLLLVRLITPVAILLLAGYLYYLGQT